MDVSFGEKLLNKMGLNEKGYIGNNKKNYQENLIEAIPRQTGLGLGADNSEAQQDAKEKNIDLQKNPSDLQKFDEVYVIQGQHQGITGIIYSIKDDDINLCINQKIIQIKRQDIVHKKYKQNFIKKDKKEEDSQYQWIDLDLKVRFISKILFQGKYYLKKARVLDIISSTNITLIFQDKNIVQNIKQNDLQTVISKNDLNVKIIVGKYKNHKAKIINLDFSDKTAKIIIDDLDIILDMKFNQICNYYNQNIKKYIYHTQYNYSNFLSFFYLYWSDKNNIKQYRYYGKTKLNNIYFFIKILIKNQKVHQYL